MSGRESWQERERRLQEEERNWAELHNFRLRIGSQEPEDPEEQEEPEYSPQTSNSDRIPAHHSNRRHPVAGHAHRSHHTSSSGHPPNTDDWQNHDAQHTVGGSSRDSLHPSQYRDPQSDNTDWSSDTHVHGGDWSTQWNSSSTAGDQYPYGYPHPLPGGSSGEISSLDINNGDPSASGHDPRPLRHPVSGHTGHHSDPNRYPLQSSGSGSRSRNADEQPRRHRRRRHHNSN